MKLYYLSLIIIFMFLIGCSTTYKVTNYVSKEDLYKKANSSMKSRDVNVVTIDSSFTAFEGSRIKDDSLQIVAKIQETLSLKDIKKIKYYGNAYEEPSAYIWLKNGKELKQNKVKIISDSTIQFSNFIMTNEYIPVDKVKIISYKTWWQSTLIGIPFGLVSGTLIGGMLGGTVSHNDEGDISMVVGALGGAIIGTITGAILGYIIGYKNIYQFHL